MSSSIIRSRRRSDTVILSLSNRDDIIGRREAFYHIFFHAIAESDKYDNRCDSHNNTDQRESGSELIGAYSRE